MKTGSIALGLCALTAFAAEPGMTIGTGHVDTVPLSLLLPDVRAARMAPIHAVPRTTDITFPSSPFVIDKTDLIANRADQLKVLRSLHIDPAPKPPGNASGSQASRPLGKTNGTH